MGSNTLATEVSMADFDLETFVSAPTVEQLDKCRKDDLLCIAAHFQIAVLKQRLKKEIKSTVSQRLAELGVLVLPAGVGEVLPGADSHSEEEEQSETAEMEGSEVKSVLPPFDPFSPNSDEFAGSNARTKVRIARLQMEARERAEIRRADVEFRLEVRRLEIDADTQIKLRELELNAAKVTPAPVGQPLPAADVSARAGSEETNFEVSRHISLVPQFRETEVDSYFSVFERIASTLHWPKEVWPLLLQCKLMGKAQDVCATLSLEDSVNDEVVKLAILRAYELVPEAYRQQFRCHKKSSNQSFVEFAREKSILFDKWCTSSKVNDVKDMRELILLEDFKNCVSERVVVYLNEQKVSSLSQASVLADEFVLTHKNVFTPARPERAMSSRVNQSSFSRPKVTVKSKEDRECFYCHQVGHLIADCVVLKRKQPNSVPKSAGFVKLVDSVKVEGSDKPESSYAPFLLEGLISVTGKSDEQIRVKMLRDTGAMQSFISADVLPFSDQTSCGSNVLIQGIEMGLVQVPLHQVHLESELCTGFVKVAVRARLPVSGVQFILGNDLAGGKVMPLLEVFDNSGVSDQPDELARFYPETFSACVVTRSQAKELDTAGDLATSFMASSFISDVLSDESKTEKLFVPKPSEITLRVTREMVITAQKEDESLQMCFAATVLPEKVQERKTAYYVENDLLMRKWCSTTDDAEWSSVYQIVVPSCYRQHVLSLAHDHDLSGHLGVKKTYYGILRHFFLAEIKS